jgi:hypothetical protein
MVNEIDLKSDTFPSNGMQFYAVSAGSAVLFEIQQALSWY